MMKTSKPLRKLRNPTAPPRDQDNAILNFDEAVSILRRESPMLKTSEDYCVSPKSINAASNDSSSMDLHFLQEQVTNLKKTVDRQYNLSMQKARNTCSMDRDDNLVRLLKAQKVQLLCKLKMNSVQFRLSKAALEKENLHLKKEQRKDQFEMHKLVALNERQKLVLRRKTEEATLAFKRLSSLLQSEIASAKGIESELKHSLKVAEMRSEYERQMEEMQDELLKFEEEAEMLRDENFRLTLQMKEMESLADACELKELKRQVGEISAMVGTIALQNSERSNPKMEKCQEMDNGKKSSSRKCCSCSKKSLCKTQKCECLASGGLCGSDCGCSSSKCSNREHPKDGSGIREPLTEVRNTKSLPSVKKSKRGTRK